MKHHVYIATGSMNGILVMKIGTSNNPTRRQKEIKIRVEYIHVCNDASEAFTLEARMRHFWLIRKGKRLSRRKDWFEYNQELYNDMISLFIAENWAAFKVPVRISDRQRIHEQKQRARHEVLFVANWEGERIILLKEKEVLTNQLKFLQSQYDNRPQYNNEELVRRLAEAELMIKLYESGRLTPPKSVE